MNFIETYKRGKEDKSIRLSTGIPALDITIKKLKKAMIIGVAAAPKVGKTVFADFAFVIQPYLDAERQGILHKFHITYFSFEVDRVEKEYKFAAFVMYWDHKITTFTYKGVIYPIDDDYLMGNAIHRNANGSLEQIKVLPEHEELLKIVYKNRIVPLFGEWSVDGKRVLLEPDGTLKPRPIINLIEEQDNPTGIYKQLKREAQVRGRFLIENYETLDDHNRVVTKTREAGYIPNDPEAIWVVVIDHVRAVSDERGYNKKQLIDKTFEYERILKKMCGITFVNVMHSNRGIANVDRLKFHGENIYPTSDDVKDSGNPSEDCTVFITLFNPHDEKYNLEKHMGIVLNDFPNYRSIHITENRRGPCPVHIQANFYHGINLITKLG